ncbi:TetR/AcrR family transcriptional regulator [Roseobacter denitrificans]|uniref:Transcriptional regulator, putative n=1 Tax=Roseobacter denitrificans (strain ATCC 33942 / OCh 114) TaxID=375451 RepID=Q166N7_ROSDO|nr:TetR/AcrR family transcriptional regulator [Roseobacter denitrificans]ABG32056.1 transcriptional regulator, putative [Roseobacter denitrificans OCh 114]AVL51580.1 TetR/AcrR family transcriptional regulator [Roseobacter denitrificans]SFF76747.1 transcriptional regulator, TetR family [Roseobacter denitrificans OCh 114]
MGRRSSIGEEDLIKALSRVFRDMGYEGATLSSLSQETGLRRASLYHRFPSGKEQMAQEVLAASENWLTENLFEPLKGDAPAEQRLQAMTRKLDALYSSGKQACILNMLSSANGGDNPFAAAIKRIFNALIDSFATLAEEQGFDKSGARARAERAVMLLHGSLVLSRGMGSQAPFERFLETLPDELLGRP